MVLFAIPCEKPRFREIAQIDDETWAAAAVLRCPRRTTAVPITTRSSRNDTCRTLSGLVFVIVRLAMDAHADHAVRAEVVRERAEALDRDVRAPSDARVCVGQLARVPAALARAVRVRLEPEASLPIAMPDGQ